MIWSTVALDLIGFGIVLPLLPLYSERFGAGPLAAAGLITAFSAAQFVFAPVWGRLSDRIGRKPVLVLALCGSAIGALTSGLAGSLWVLYLGRVIDGASGSSYAVAQAAVGDLAPPAQRSRLLGLLGAAFGAGFVLGPVIGGLAALGDRRLPFFIAAALAAINAVAALIRVPETRGGDEVADPNDRVAAATRSRLSHDVRRLVSLAFVAMFAFAGFEATFSLLMDRRFDASTSTIYVALAAIGLALVFVQVRVVGGVTGRFGERVALRLALAVVAAGLLVLAVDGGWAVLVVALVLLVVGQGVVGPSLTSATIASATPSRRGEVLGYQASASALGRIGGPLVAGAVFDAAGSGWPYVVAAVVAAVGVVAVPLGASADDASPDSGEVSFSSV